LGDCAKGENDSKTKIENAKNTCFIIKTQT